MRKLLNLPVWIAWIICGLLLTGRLMGFGAHPILSGSMEPVMHTGSVAIIKNVPISTLQKGDIIAFKNGDQGIGIAHRIVSVKHDNKGKYTFVTKGDANRSEDAKPYVTNATELGKIYFSIPKLGYLSSFLHTQYGIFIISALFALTITLILWPSKKE